MSCSTPLLDAMAVQLENRGNPREIAHIIAEMDQKISQLETRIRRDSDTLQRLMSARAEQSALLQRLSLQDEPESVIIRRPRIVLIVESDDVNRRFISHVIDKADHVPVEASTAKQALRHLSNTPIDLIVADIDLNDMDGITFVSAVREDLGKTDLPIILTTMALERRHIALIADHTVQGHLVKPVRRDLLLTLAVDLLEDAGSNRREPRA